MDQFLEIHNLPRLTQEETDDLNRLISIKEFESIINNLPKQKAPGSDGSPVKYTKHLRKKLYQFSTISFREYKQMEYFQT